MFWQNASQKQLKEEKFVLDDDLKGYCQSWWGQQGIWGNWPHYSHLLRKRKRWMLVLRSVSPLSSFIQSRTPVYGTVPPMFRVDLPSPVKSRGKCPHSQTQSHVLGDSKSSKADSKKSSSQTMSLITYSLLYCAGQNRGRVLKEVVTSRLWCGHIPKTGNFLCG